MKNVMVINMGLKSIRCIIFNQNGVKLGSYAIAINTAINDYCVEQDPNEWWEKAKLVMANSLKEAGKPYIDFITVTSSASCLVCVDKNGNALQRAYMVSDKRAEEEAKEIKSTREFTNIYNETGVDISSSLMLPKILWVKRHLSDYI